MAKVGIRTEEEIKFLKKSGWIAACALKKTLESAKEGISLIELDKIAEKEIIKLGGQSSFKTVPGYQFTTCLTLNAEIVHGIPRDIKLVEGDILSVDLGAVYPAPAGWHTDAAWSILIGQCTGDGQQEEKKRFLEIGEKTLWRALEKAVAGGRIGDISATIQQEIEGAGYNVVKSLAGHGVGRLAHEEPEIPTFGKNGTGLQLQKGMSVAVEIIYTIGKGKIFEKKDGWTIASKDKSLGGLFEMSIIVRDGRPEVLTDWRVV